MIEETHTREVLADMYAALNELMWSLVTSRVPIRWLDNLEDTLDRLVCLDETCRSAE